METRALTMFEVGMEHLQEGVLFTDARLEGPGPTILYVNQALCRMTGYEPHELIGQTVRILRGPGTAELARGKTLTGETINHRKDGSEYLCEWTVAPVHGPDGTITQWVFVQRDVTAARRTEERAGLLRTAVHELRSPMEALTALLSLLQCEATENRCIEDMAELARVTEREVHRLGRLLDEILQAVEPTAPASVPAD